MQYGHSISSFLPTIYPDGSRAHIQCHPQCLPCLLQVTLFPDKSQLTLQKGIYFMDKSGTAFGAFNSLEGILQFSLFFIPQLPLMPVPTQNLSVNMFAAFIHFSYLVYKDSQPFYSKSKITPPNSQSISLFFTKKFISTIAFTSSTRLLNEEIQRVQNEDNQDYVKIIHRRYQ